jgi:hypothetical protein
MQNNLRGLWAEAMVGELLGDDWTFTGNDWSGWDHERSDGLRLEVKQSARHQSWGTETTSPRFSIAGPAGSHPDGKTWASNPDRTRLADICVFAWQDGRDQRLVPEWRFHVIRADRLPLGQKSIGLSAIRRLAEAVDAPGLRLAVEQTAAT